MSAEREELEIKLAFLERANGELSDVAYRQQRELDALRERVTMLEGELGVIKELLDVR